MTRNYTLCAALCVFTLASLFSCNKQDTVSSTSTAQSATSLNKLFSELKSTPQTFHVTAGQRQTIYGAKGTKLTFYPNSFKDASGNVITSGTIDISLTEMYKPNDMIANKTTTTTDGHLLRSGGQINIQATSNGNTVYANKYQAGFKQPSSTWYKMSLYYGATTNTSDIPNWTVADTSKTGTTLYNSSDSVGNIYFLFDSCSQFNWINCDQFYSFTEAPVDIKVAMPDATFNTSNTIVFIIFPDANSVARLDAYNPTLAIFDLQAGIYVPAGKNFNVVVLTSKNDKYYYYEQSGLVATPGMKVTATMTQQDISYIKSHISGL